jgi:hypothetical protein
MVPAMAWQHKIPDQLLQLVPGKARRGWDKTVLQARWQGIHRIDTMSYQKIYKKSQFVLENRPVQKHGSTSDQRTTLVKGEGGGDKGRRQEIKKDRDQKEKATRAALHARIRPTSIYTSTHLHGVASVKHCVMAFARSIRVLETVREPSLRNELHAVARKGLQH